MSSDPNKKSPRNFQCRDMLWETFEQMARELECSVDYLINEAMKQYARQRSYGPSSRSGGASSEGYGSAPPPPAAPPPGLRPPPSRLPPPPPQGMRGGAPSLPAPPGRTGGRPSTVPLGVPPSVRPIPPAPRSVPPPIPSARPGGASASGGYPTAPQGASLNVIYQGDKFPVNKDRFVIGRGKQSSDLTLKDPNVSRQHAMIEFQNGVYFMVDMGSTNGVEFNGQRIARKQIAEGDVFRICDHDLHFTFR